MLIMIELIMLIIFTQSLSSNIRIRRIRMHIIFDGKLCISLMVRQETSLVNGVYMKGSGKPVNLVTFVLP